MKAISKNHQRQWAVLFPLWGSQGGCYDSFPLRTCSCNLNMRCRLQVFTAKAKVPHSWPKSVPGCNFSLFHSPYISCSKGNFVTTKNIIKKQVLVVIWMEGRSGSLSGSPQYLQRCFYRPPPNIAKTCFIHHHIFTTCMCKWSPLTYRWPRILSTYPERGVCPCVYLQDCLTGHFTATE